MTYLVHALEAITIAALCAMYLLARRERKAKEKLIGQNTAMRLALRDASDELYVASATFSHKGESYWAARASSSAELAREAGES